MEERTRRGSVGRTAHPARRWLLPPSPGLPAFSAARWRAATSHYQEERAATHDALRQACVQYASYLEDEIDGDDDARALEEVERHQATLTHVLDRALDTHHWDDAQQIARILSENWDRRGIDDEPRALVAHIRQALQAAIVGAPALDAPAGGLWLFTLYLEAELQREAGNLDSAEESLRHILDAFGDSPPLDRQGELATVYNRLGVIAQSRGNLDAADDWHRRCLAIQEALENEAGVAFACLALGSVASQRPELTEARNLYMRALRLFENDRNQRHIAACYHELGHIAQLAHDLDDAEHWHLEAIALDTALGDKPRLAIDYQQLGSIARLRSNLDVAENLYRKALAIREDLGTDPDLSSTYFDLGMTAQISGRWDEAEAWLRRSLAIDAELGNDQHMAVVDHHLDMVAEARGRVSFQRRVERP